MESEYAKAAGLDGKYFLFYKVGEARWWSGHIIPVVKVKITKDHTLPATVEEFDELEYVQVDMSLYENRFSVINVKNKDNTTEYLTNAAGQLPIYILSLSNTSKRVIPKNLVYIGNFPKVKPPELEYIPRDEVSIFGVLWKSFDKVIIKRYCHYKSLQGK